MQSLEARNKNQWILSKNKRFTYLFKVKEVRFKEKQQVKEQERNKEARDWDFWTFHIILLFMDNFIVYMLIFGGMKRSYCNHYCRLRAAKLLLSLDVVINLWQCLGMSKNELITFSGPLGF